MLVLVVAAIAGAAQLFWDERCSALAGNPTIGTIVVCAAASFAVATAARFQSPFTVFWAMAALDFGVALQMATKGSDQLTQAMSLFVHAACCVVAGAWSFTARGLGPIARAKAAEAGRSLATAWIVIAVLIVTEALGGHLAISEQTRTLTALLVVAALVVVTGSGYTKLVEATRA